MPEHEHTVYILKCKDNSLYTGYTNNLENRLKMHNEGKGAKYTRGRGPFQVVYIERFSSKEKAMKKEYTIKQLTRKEKLQLIRAALKEVIKYEHSTKL
ncbi:MAG: GIY-YIG nuclease family protein [Bacillota bacterium]|uniref:GIY-YIG nuclease family protein n=1 Tax=Virgibacillus salarius TaxID=447199 RepID=A0A941DU49_9BACI|nr:MULTISPECIES: GIY-YIG nuclease family protein [Bacillaceae]NAZ09485.1 GIY-YIG nuclease family protein [Agaribacter marinus]MBR7796775.1 GIY-YIG nuclease family protein [Virgibacillus salarius]MCC2250577.1 GIY-YIG nuclease family protein [Virgibacillus sp. AGTR]MDY7045094.1 GIY-YIG nuclease family protein [Virgibacillus sp. M23]QRZ19078.1 GIY-YIG nuclease family protein [Virgibacillus sp. AGTR]